jgi:hypothetical protein
MERLTKKVLEIKLVGYHQTNPGYTIIFDLR